MNEALHVLRLAGIRHVLDVPAATGASSATSGKESAHDPASIRQVGGGNQSASSAPRVHGFDTPDSSGTVVLSAPPWPAILAKVPATARCVFTYADLGEDLAGTPSRERGQLWRRLLALLRMPPGSVAFLPYMLPGGGEQQLAYEGFAQALWRVRPASVLAFTDCDAQTLQGLLHRAGEGGADILLFTAPPPDALFSISDNALLSSVPDPDSLLDPQA